MQLEFTAFGLTVDIEVRPLRWAYVRVGGLSSYVSFWTGKGAKSKWRYDRHQGGAEVWAGGVYLSLDQERSKTTKVKSTDGLQGT